MLHPDLIKKIKYLEIHTKHLVNDMFGGEYHSAFKGMGMEFAEVREYAIGDDIRNIDWNVTARYGKPFIKKYNEERELTVMLMIDISASGYFGTGNRLKSDTIIEIASILSFSAIRNNDKVGIILFSNDIEMFIPPKKGKTHVLRVIRELLLFKPKKKSTNISLAIEFVIKILKRKSVVFLISDYLGKSFGNSLKIINQKHDLIALQIYDKFEVKIPNIGLIKIEDNENGAQQWIDTTDKNIFDKMKYNIQESNLKFIKFCNKNKIDLIIIKNQDSYIEPLIQFFKNRLKRN